MIETGVSFADSASTIFKPVYRLRIAGDRYLIEVLSSGKFEIHSAYYNAFNAYSALSALAQINTHDGKVPLVYCAEHETVFDFSRFMRCEICLSTPSAYPEVRESFMMYTMLLSALLLSVCLCAFLVGLFGWKALLFLLALGSMWLIGYSLIREKAE